MFWKEPLYQAAATGDQVQGTSSLTLAVVDAGGVSVTVSNLQEELVFTLPLSSANPVSQSHLLRVGSGQLPLQMVECSFFDPLTRSISTQGCRLVNVQSDGTVECACTHMTDFMGFLRSGLSVLSGANYDVLLAIGQLSPSNLVSNIGFYFALGFTALLLLTVLLCRGLDR